MNTKSKLEYFINLINCNHDLFLWSYDSNYKLLETNAPFQDIIERIGFRERIVEHIATGKRTPIILETKFDLLWIAGFEFTNNMLVGIHLLGAAFIGRDTPVLLLKKIDAYDLSVKLRASLTRMISDFPVLPINTLSSYATMLHYTLNNEKLLLTDIVHSTSSKSEINKNETLNTDEHSGIWLAEQRLCQMFEDGNANFAEALSHSFSLSSGMKVDISDTLRKSKNNAIVLLTLCSRSCIRGGLSPVVAYNLNDYYAKIIEGCKTISELNRVCSDMTTDYVTRVRSAKATSSISTYIQNTCDYIKQHLDENISIELLAKRIGYTTYYFSHKFKLEVGLSVNEYLIKEKINQAKLLLSGTTNSIQSISDSLSFCNRSYFYSCFQKYEGISPSNYRKQHAKL
ncbi:MAG: helix-turn-helix domain-containing protein [Suipraeoptans sp.]